MKQFVFFLMFSLSAGSIYPMDVESFLGSFEKLVSEMKGYQVRISQWSKKDEKTENKIMNYYHEFPDSIRIDVIEGNRGEGSTGILNSDGKVGVRGGSRILPIKLKLDLNHRFVTTTRGRTFLDASLTGILESLKNYHWQCDVSLRTSVSYITLAVSTCEKVDQSFERVVIQFDRNTLLPTSSDTYENGDHVEHVVWSSYSVESDLPDHIFNLSVSQRELKKTGVVRLAAIEVSAEERVSAGLPAR